MAGVHAKIRALTITQRRAARSCAILWMTCMGKGVVGSDRSGPQILVALLAPAKGRCSAENRYLRNERPVEDLPSQREMPACHPANG
jgi:hypothetical protein